MVTVVTPTNDRIGKATGGLWGENTRMLRLKFSPALPFMRAEVGAGGVA
jgi:hypothetical protein